MQSLKEESRSLHIHWNVAKLSRKLRYKPAKKRRIPMEKKKELRKRIALLKTLHKSTATHQSAEILAALEAHPVFRTASIILLYHSLPDEVHTHDFIRKWSTKKKILLPVVIGNDLELRVYTSPADLAIGAYGIEEPTGALFTDYATINLVIVPGVAFDREEEVPAEPFDIRMDEIITQQ